MKLFKVTINHPRGGQRDLTIAGEEADSVATKCETAGLHVDRVELIEDITGVPVAPAEPNQKVPEPKTPEPTGRIYGKSAEGPRRNKEEMEQDRRIEALAKEAEYGIPPDVELVADTLEAELLEKLGRTGVET